MKPRMRLFFHTTLVLKIRQMLRYSALGTPPVCLSISGHKRRAGSQAQLAGWSAEARGGLERDSGAPRGASPPLMDSAQGLPVCGCRMALVR